jgi:hypothetical protein
MVRERTEPAQPVVGPRNIVANEGASTGQGLNQPRILQAGQSLAHAAEADPETSGDADLARLEAAGIDSERQTLIRGHSSGPL